MMSLDVREIKENADIFDDENSRNRSAEVIERIWKENTVIKGKKKSNAPKTRD